MTPKVCKLTPVQWARCRSGSALCRPVLLSSESAIPGSFRSHRKRPEEVFPNGIAHARTANSSVEANSPARFAPRRRSLSAKMGSLGSCWGHRLISAPKLRLLPNYSRGPEQTALLCVASYWRALISTMFSACCFCENSNH